MAQNHTTQMRHLDPPRRGRASTSQLQPRQPNAPHPRSNCQSTQWVIFALRKPTFCFTNTRDFKIELAHMLPSSPNTTSFENKKKQKFIFR